MNQNSKMMEAGVSERAMNFTIHKSVGPTISIYFPVALKCPTAPLPIFVVSE